MAQHIFNKDDSATEEKSRPCSFGCFIKLLMHMQIKLSSTYVLLKIFQYRQHLLPIRQATRKTVPQFPHLKSEAWRLLIKTLCKDIYQFIYMSCTIREFEALLSALKQNFSSFLNTS